MVSHISRKTSEMWGTRALVWEDWLRPQPFLSSIMLWRQAPVRSPCLVFQ
jgi:hypothetical protein